MPGQSDNWSQPLPSVEQYALQGPNPYGNNLWGPPQQPPQVMSQIADWVNKAQMAMDPSQGIPYMISQQPGMQNRPVANDLLGAIWGMLTPGNMTGKATRSLNELPVARGQLEPNVLSQQRRGGVFFRPGDAERNFYITGAKNLASAQAKYPTLRLEGGNVPVSATFNTSNTLMPVRGEPTVERLLPRLIGQAAYDDVNHLAVDRVLNKDKYYSTLGKYGINKKEADAIPDKTSWAIPERVLAEVARKQGYNSVVAQPTRSPSEVFVLKPYRGYDYPLKNIKFGEPKP